MEAARATAPVSGWRYAIGAGSGLVAIGLLLHLSDPARAAGVATFGVVFSSLLIEAIPFIALGAVVSALIEVFVPARVISRLAALPAPLQVPASGLAGLCFPVCECGSVPVARRLVAKGLTPAAAITFMLAAPVLNPVVLASTAIAYRGRDSMWTMVVGRAGLGLVVAIASGWVIAGASPGALLRGPAAASHSHEGRAAGFFGHLAGDFLFMGRYLVLGAALAAALQTFVPQDVVASVADLPVVDLAAMMALAFVLSLCSESDAFVAASFVQFGIGAQLAFLVFGPMVDTKLGVLYTGTFSRAFTRAVVVAVFAVTLAGTLWIEVFFG